MNDTPNPRTLIGGNHPPVTIADEMLQKYQHLDSATEEALTDYGTPPDKITNDIIHAKVVELGKKLRKLEKALEDTRDSERAPYRQKVEEINGWFNVRMDRLETARKKLTLLHKEYAEAKAAAEKKRLAEEAEKKRQTEEEALRLANEANRTKMDAESASKNAETLADIARQARDVATTNLQTVMADFAMAKADAAKITARLAEIDAQFAQARRDKQEATEDQRKAARADLEAALNGAKQNIRDADATLQDARHDADRKRHEQRAAEEAAADAERAKRAAEREEKQAMDTAVRADKAATRIEEKIAGPDADLARVRSEHGAVGTLTRRWKAEVIDRDKLDKVALWPFINGEALDSALWKWMQAQVPENRKMAGARIEQETEGMVV